jgi:hypothetical protein
MRRYHTQLKSRISHVEVSVANLEIGSNMSSPRVSIIHHKVRGSFLPVRFAAPKIVPLKKHHGLANAHNLAKNSQKIV